MLIYFYEKWQTKKCIIIYTYVRINFQNSISILTLTWVRSYIRPCVISLNTIPEKLAELVPSHRFGFSRKKQQNFYYRCSISARPWGSERMKEHIHALRLTFTTHSTAFFPSLFASIFYIVLSHVIILRMKYI